MIDWLIWFEDLIRWVCGIRRAVPCIQMDDCVRPCAFCSSRVVVDQCSVCTAWYCYSHGSVQTAPASALPHCMQLECVSAVEEGTE